MLGVKCLGFFLSKNILVLLSLYIFWGKCVYFSILNDEIHNYVFFDIIVNLVIQKLKSKHTSLKKYYKGNKTKWAKLRYFSLILREQEEKKRKIIWGPPIVKKSANKCFGHWKTLHIWPSFSLSSQIAAVLTVNSYKLIGILVL